MTSNSRDIAGDNKTPPAGRAKLIEAALSCMADFGIKGTTVRSIAERADVTLGLVRHHFGTKEWLLVETYQHLNDIAVVQIANAIMVNKDDPDLALEGAIQAMFPPDLSDVRQMRILVAFWGLVPSNPNFAKVQAQTNAAIHALFVEMIEMHQGQSKDAHDIAHGIVALSDGLWLECCMNPACMSPTKAIRIATSFCKARLGLADTQVLTVA